MKTPRVRQRLGILLTTVIAASSLQGLASANETAGPSAATPGPFAVTMKSYLDAYGVQPNQETWSEILKLGQFIDETIREITTAEGGPFPKIIPPFSVEGCSGKGSCGGTHKDDQGHYNYYVMNGTYTQGNVCSGNEFITNTQIGDNPKACYQVQQAQMCAAGNCTRLDPDQPLSMQLSDPANIGFQDADDFLVAIRTPATESDPPVG